MGWVRIGLMLALGGWGCGGTGVSPSPEFATAPDGSVLTPAVRKVTLTSKGGGIGGGPCSPAGVCPRLVWSYTLSLDTKRLAFDGYLSQGGPTMPVLAMDDVSLSAPQFETLTAAARAVTVSARTGCGADLNERELRVESADAALTYGDDFYACVMNYDHFVKYDGLDKLQTVFEAIAP
jgi:hypothetical protein